MFTYLRQARRDCELSRAARLAGRSRQTISNIELCMSPSSVALVERIAGALGVSSDTLIDCVPQGGRHVTR